MFSGNALVLRSIGYSGFTVALDWLFAWTPLASVMILLLVGLFVAIKKEGLSMGKLLLAWLLALTPLAVHFVVIKLTFAVNPQQPRLVGPLSVVEWAVLLVGCLLLGVGLSLLLQIRGSGTKPPTRSAVSNER
jgi:hypothetical protein